MILRILEIFLFICYMTHFLGFKLLIHDAKCNLQSNPFTDEYSILVWCIVVKMLCCMHV